MTLALGNGGDDLVSRHAAFQFADVAVFERPLGSERDFDRLVPEIAGIFIEIIDGFM